MIGSLPLGFAQPLVLLGLLSLPVLWWLLRLVPPRPRRVDFPPTRLLFEIAQKEETPSRTPWWLTLLRLTLAALIIIAAAGPMWNPPLATTDRAAPLLIMLDDGWPAAASWDARLRTADEMIARAEADNRGVAILPLSETDRDISLGLAGAARVQIKQVKPKPFGVDRSAALPLIERFLAAAPNVEVVWLSDGVDLGKGATFVDGLKRAVGNHPLSIVEGGLPIPHALAAADNAAGALTVKVLRAQNGAGDIGMVSAIDLKGLPLGEAPFNFKSGGRETDAVIDLPVEIRNDVARLEIVGERSAGAVQLLDKRWRRRTVGIVSGSTADRSQPLIGATYYLSRALNPFADVRLAEGVAPAEAINQFLDRKLPMLILADVGNVNDALDQLNKWIDNGGVLVRFAGPHLAGADDKLVPVKLRRGGRILGGSLSWDKPQQLAAFSREGPFNGMVVPTDVTVTRQVLAEPDSQLTDRTWATLADGTPLVTAERRGNRLTSHEVPRVAGHVEPCDARHRPEAVPHERGRGEQEHDVEAADERGDVHRVAAPADQHPALAGRVVAGVEGPPPAVKVDLHPGGEVHRLGRRRDVHVGEVAEDVASRDRQCPAKADRDMGEVAADAAAGSVGVRRGGRRDAAAVIETQVAVDVVADRPHPPVARLLAAEQPPRLIPEDVGQAVPAG